MTLQSYKPMDFSWSEASAAMRTPHSDRLWPQRVRNAATRITSTGALYWPYCQRPAWMTVIKLMTSFTMLLSTSLGNWQVMRYCVVKFQPVLIKRIDERVDSHIAFDHLSIVSSTLHYWPVFRHGSTSRTRYALWQHYMPSYLPNMLTVRRGGEWDAWMLLA